MLPLWAHGLFSKSEAYKDSKLALEAVAAYKEKYYPISGLVLPINYANDYLDGQSKLVSDIRAKFPLAKDLQLIYPLSYFVPDHTQPTPSWIDDFKSGKFAVQAEGEDLYVEIDDGMKGWCMDVMNPKFADFLGSKLLYRLQDLHSAIWLEGNAPYIKNHTHTFKDNWEDIPYRPDGGFMNTSTLPEQATHNLGNGKTEFHSNLHGLYGSTFAK